MAETPHPKKPRPPAPDLSPEGRRRQGLSRHWKDRVGPGTRFFEIVKRVAVGTFNDGMIHAGNLAYLSVISIFPFFITGAAIFSLFGDQADRTATVYAVLVSLPPSVSNVIEPVAQNVVGMRQGWLLWAGALFGLWTVGGLIETIRDILRRAYGTQLTKAFWIYRLFSTAMIIGAVILLMLSLIAQVIIGAAQQVIQEFFPQFSDLLGSLAWSRIVPVVGLFGSIFLLFYTLTPARYRSREFPKWPGALLATVWWTAVTFALPPLLRNVFNYDLTYGSLAGFMIVLFFFWLVGLGLVMGAELNAALAEAPDEDQDAVGQADNRVRVARAEAVEDRSQ